ncbi:MAG: HP0268 family nuclease, partial [Campylobacter sp.]
DNTHKQLISLVENFEKKGFSVYHHIVKYGLDENDYCYEVHIL